MKDLFVVDADESPPPGDVPKRRRCLRCREPFASQWAGERICARCKGSSTWKSGVPLHARPSSIGHR